MDQQNTINRKAAIIGIGESPYYKHGESPVSEFMLAIEAIKNAAEDAGMDIRDLDGFCSFSDERNDPVRMSTALGIPDIAFSNMFWSGGGGGVCGAVGNAAAALLAGYCKYAVVYRSLAQGQFRRFGEFRYSGHVWGRMAYTAPYGVLTPVHQIALRTRRFMFEHNVTDEVLAAVALTSYAHAQRNPRAVMYGQPLTREKYYAARRVVEPFRLYDCCLENDGAAAVILTTAERARDHRQKPAYLMASAQGTSARYELNAHINEDYGTANFQTVAPRLFNMAGISPQDVDVAQIYENFTGGVVMSMVEHGFCTTDSVMDFCTEENLQWPNGKLPINTSGGNLAECYTHGLELVNEAVRQIRSTSTSQVPDAEISLVAGGPVTAPVSNLILCN